MTNHVYFAFVLGVLCLDVLCLVVCLVLIYQSCWSLKITSFKEVTCLLSYGFSQCFGI